MKKIRFQLLNVFLTVLITSCSVTEKICQWQEKTITPDGIPAEYSIPLNHYDSETKIQFTFSNDLENLYFCIRATEEEAQLKILRAGVQILIDTTGNEKGFVSIQFPLPRDKNQGPPPNDQPEVKPESDHSNRPHKAMEGDKEPGADLKEMVLEGFKGPINGRVPVNSHGIGVAIKFDADKNLTYEGVIPFKTFYRENLSALDGNRQFMVWVKLNAMIAPQMEKEFQGPPMNGAGNRPPRNGESGGRQGGNRPQGGGGMAPDNGMQQPNGGRPDGGGESMESSKSYPFNTVNIIKIKYLLAVNQIK
jgi:hypothetical protein